MLTTLVAATTLLSGQTMFREPWRFPDLEKTYERFQVSSSDGKLVQPKVCPKHEWGFDYVSAGYAALSKDPLQWDLRFRVFSQERAERGDLSPIVARLLLRLWEFNYERMKLDHADAYRRMVDVYLCKQGEAGGEQLFTVDTSEAPGRSIKANVVFIYHLETFTNRLEQVRELAHEYGHATLPPVGTYTAPENWANGYLGERLYLRWLLQEQQAGRLSIVDMLGATVEDLKGYVAQKVIPLVKRAASLGPNDPNLKKLDASGMDSYMGLALYAESLLPYRVFGAALVLGGQKATNFPATLAAEVEARPGIVLETGEFAGQKIWIPAGKLKPIGIKPIQSKSGWIQIIAPKGTVELTN